MSFDKEVFDKYGRALVYLLPEDGQDTYNHYAAWHYVHKVYKLNETTLIDSMISLRVFKGRICIMTTLFLISSVLVFDNIPVLLANSPVIDGCDVVPSIPSSGNLGHERDGSMEKYGLDVNVKDFIAEATFYNPYSSTEGDWDYGFLFRSQNDTFHVIRVTSDEEWFHYVVTDGEWKKIEEDSVYSLKIGANENNHIYIIVIDDRGLLYLNGDLLALLDISEVIEKGSISVATGIAGDTEIEGKVTRFEDFNVWSLDSHTWLRPYLLPHSITEDREEYWYSSNVNVKDFIAEATFCNPCSSVLRDWDYGFLFRSQNDTFHVIRVTSDEEWFHYVVTDGEWKKIEGGRAYGLRTGSSGKNRLCIIILGEMGFFYLNSEFVASLDTSELILEGDISATISLCNGPNLSSQECLLTNFAVWSFDGCPKPRSDKDSDGVPDTQDNCLNLGCTIVDSQGCPKDSDGDKIRDCDDQCPSVYGSVNNNGCPAPSPTIPSESGNWFEKLVSWLENLPLIRLIIIIAAISAIPVALITVVLYMKTGKK